MVRQGGVLVASTGPYKVVCSHHVGPYERNGVSSLFMLFAPLDGWRRVEVRERRTKVDSHVIKKLVDEDP